MSSCSANAVIGVAAGFVAGAVAVAGGAALVTGMKRRREILTEDIGAAKKGRVPIFVMMPLDTVTDDGNAVRDLETRKAWLQGLKNSGVEGVMVDVWWGLCETAPQQYNFKGYLEFAKLLKSIGLKMQAVMSFHQCGGNVGDSVWFPIPKFVLEPAKEKGLLYSDRFGQISEDCLSLSADKEVIFAGAGSTKRDALTCYGDYMKAFAKEFSDYLGNTIIEIQVGMGPCGELRYPSYLLSKGWNYPGVGLIMAHDKGMARMLKAAAATAAKPEFGEVPESAPKDTCAFPEDSPMFTKVASGKGAHWSTGHGAFFLNWYRSTLLAHGEAVLMVAHNAFPQMKDLVFSVKVSGIHWHTMHPSRAAETCAGYAPNPETGVGAYTAIAKMLGSTAKATGREIFFNFTCLEMSNRNQGPGMPQADSSPEDLIAEVRRACLHEGVHLCGENALQFGLPEDPGALGQILTQTRGWASGVDKMHAVTLLRLDEGFCRPCSLVTLKKWISTL